MRGSPSPRSVLARTARDEPERTRSVVVSWREREGVMAMLAGENGETVMMGERGQID